MKPSTTAVTNVCCAKETGDLPFVHRVFGRDGANHLPYWVVNVKIRRVFGLVRCAMP